MTWTARPKLLGNLVQIALGVSEVGDDVGSLAGHLTLSSAQWLDFAKRMVLREGSGEVWRSDPDRFENTPLDRRTGSGVA